MRLYTSTIQRQILYFLVHYIYMTATATGYFSDLKKNNDKLIKYIVQGEAVGSHLFFNLIWIAVQIFQYFTK